MTHFQTRAAPDSAQERPSGAISDAAGTVEGSEAAEGGCCEHRKCPGGSLCCCTDATRGGESR